MKYYPEGSKYYSPEVAVLLGKPDLTNVEKICGTTWQTHVKNGKRIYENVFLRAYDEAECIDYIIVCGCWSKNSDWDVRLRIPSSNVIHIDTELSLIAYLPDSKASIVTVSNGFQKIEDIETKIPTNQPKNLRRFAISLLKNL